MSERPLGTGWCCAVLCVQLFSSPPHLMHSSGAGAALDPGLHSLLVELAPEQILLVQRAVLRTIGLHHNRPCARVALLAPHHAAVNGHKVGGVPLNALGTGPVAHQDRRLVFEALLSAEYAAGALTDCARVLGLAVVLSI